VRLLLDANVVIAYLGSRSPEQTAVHAILVAAESAKLTLLHPEWAIAEISRVARERQSIANRVSDDRLNAVTAWIAAIASPMFMPAPPYRMVCRDPNDDAIVAAAIANDVDVVVTLDRDLLALGEHGGVLFVKPGAALALLRAEGVGESNTW
jgi:uncharacterized protein